MNRGTHMGQAIQVELELRGWLIPYDNQKTITGEELRKASKHAHENH